jgi:ribonucleoside-diphosphate reductase beta chain
MQRHSIEVSVSHTVFVTTTRGLDRTHPAWRLYSKAKRFGVWNPEEIDFTQDALDWRGLSRAEQDVLLRLTALFQAGEEAVTLDLLPLVQVIAGEGRLEEEMFLTTFLFEEAKHTEFFRRFLDEVVQSAGDLGHYHTESFRALVHTALPTALNALRTDGSPAAQARAATTYNVIVEGVLAETGYHAYLAALERNGLMPGQCAGIRLLKQDESRHIAYGLFLLARLLQEERGLWQIIEDQLNELLPFALGVVGEVFAVYAVMPFGLEEGEFLGYASEQFAKRVAWLERARDGRATGFAQVIAALDEDL